MTTLNEILTRDINRTIDGVIKADDTSRIVQEVDEYVLTKVIQKYLGKVVEGYIKSAELAGSSAPHPFNGVWISGYFGSGKSHLLKILSYLFDRQGQLSFEGKSIVERFLPKVADDIVRGDVERAAKLPATSILFNIDQQADAAKEKDENAILFIFEKVFNRMRGFMAEDPIIANFEEDLEEKKKYQEFKDFYRERNGVEWEEGRDHVLLLDQETFAETWQEFSGCTREEASRLFNRYSESYRLSVESFGKRVKKWLDTQPEPSHRLNFFVDEVGQFVAGNTRLQLNLQTIAETLGTLCEGRVWIFVTSQESFEKVIGNPDAVQTTDFSKIRDRFRYRVPLSSADVKEVIQKRLLEKNEKGRELLGTLFMKEKESFKTLFSFQEGVKELHFKDKEDFVFSYPFQAYQFYLLQQALKGLSEHNAFMGRHVSRGERSMLEIFQDVGKDLVDKPLYTWSSFDQMFAGIRNTLHSELLNAVNVAEQNLDPLSIRILKILLLVKYIPDFTATAEHLTVLLISSMDEDMGEKKRLVQESLNTLERQSYIERHGELYEYLTNEEKDVEEEIKNIQVETDEVRRFIENIVFSSVLGGTKIRYHANEQDYSFRKLIDSEIMRGGTSSDLAINIITPFHNNTGDVNTVLQQSAGKKEMIVFLNTDQLFAGDLLLYFKTENYIRQRQGHEGNPSRKRILMDKQTRNHERREQLIRECKEALEDAEIYVLDTKVNVGKKAPRQRLEEAFQVLVQSVYPHLGMLTHSYTEEGLSKILFPDDNNALFAAGGSSMEEAEKELYNYIIRKDAANERIVLSSIMHEFQGGQYGWYPFAILGLTAKLYMRDVIEILVGTKPQDTKEVYTLLKKNRDMEQIVLRPAEEIKDREVEELKRFYNEYFLSPCNKEKGKDAAIECKSALLKESEIVRDLLAKSGQYPFLKGLEPMHRLLSSLKEKEWSYFLKHLKDFEEELSFIKNETFLPIQAFMNAGQDKLWSDLSEYLNRHAANFSELETKEAAAEAKGLLHSEEPYKQNRVKKAKDLVESIKEEEKEKREELVNQAVNRVEAYEDALTQMKEFSALKKEEQSTILDPFETLKKHEIPGQEIFSVIRDKTDNYGKTLFEKARNRVLELANPKEKILYATAEEKRVPFGKAELISETDVDAYTEALSKHYKQLLKQKKRIGL